MSFVNVMYLNGGIDGITSWNGTLSFTGLIIGCNGTGSRGEALIRRKAIGEVPKSC